MDSEAKQEFLDEALKRPPKGWKVEDVQLEQSNVLASDSSRVKVTYRLPSKCHSVCARVHFVWQEDLLTPLQPPQNGTF
jgi:hypothetical protein